jgi:hypothetical protein
MIMTENVSNISNISVEWKLRFSWVQTVIQNSETETRCTPTAVVYD